MSAALYERGGGSIDGVGRGRIPGASLLPPLLAPGTCRTASKIRSEALGDVLDVLKREAEDEGEEE